MTPAGWEYEADQRHADLIVKAMNLENANSVQTPGEELKSWDQENDNKLLEHADD